MTKTSGRRLALVRTSKAIQFLIVLPGTDPLVWRRIQVPDTYSFWDLHVAIQDAMGWKDYHLHEFEVRDPRTGRLVRIGIPDMESPKERPCLAGWNVPATRFFGYHARPVSYLYDFGDGWKHIVQSEDTVPAGRGRYPRCTGGAGACPPEDVGGVQRYAEFLKAMRDPKHPEHEEFLQWIGGTFDPHAFSPDAVVFDDPKVRWRRAFEEESS